MTWEDIVSQLRPARLHSAVGASSCALPAAQQSKTSFELSLFLATESGFRKCAHLSIGFIESAQPHLRLSDIPGTHPKT
jgi:hypothetical protein